MHAHPSALEIVGDAGAGCDHPTGDLVAGDEWKTRHGTGTGPVMHIRSADPSRLDGDHHLIVGRRRIGKVDTDEGTAECFDLQGTHARSLGSGSGDDQTAGSGGSSLSV